MLDLIVNSLKSNPFPAFSLVVSILAFWFSYVTWRKTRTTTLYSDIDGRYMELLKLGILNPRFVNPALTEKYETAFRDEELLEYGRYAYAAWNIVETIVDRRSVENLRQTWYPVIREENNLHRCWLNNQENQHKFKKAFWEFMIGNEEFPCPDCLGQSLCPRCSQLRDVIESNEEIPVAHTKA